ncbi:MAG TPA: DUF4097 family beta strand repeat-containing protein [Candidatus Hydrogenedentes bacterium]|nr:DUF4097 family beta strand repeat-containing protein [Candidatus Hydrogenedentota bacterium]
MLFLPEKRMICCTRAIFPLLAMAWGGLMLSAYGQSGLMDKIQSGLNDVAKGMDYVGQKAGDILGQGLGIGESKTTPFNETRNFSETYPVGPTPIISVSNQFGEIRVNTWEDRVVQVNAVITVGAESAEVAAAITQGIQIHATHSGDLVEIQTLYPETKQDMGYVAMMVNYTITIPKTASLVTDNFFGDTIAQNIGGLLAVEAQYGLVDISDITGNVKVRTHGEFPVKAKNLAQGGVFQLHNAQAEFSGISGELQVNNFRGSIVMGNLAPDAYIDAASDGGPVHLILPADAQPDLTATVLYGTFHSDLPFSQSAQGNKLVARSAYTESKQRILLSVTFGDLRIEAQTKEGEPKPGAGPETKPFNDVISATEPAPEGTSLRIDATAGDIRIEGIDENEVRVTATRFVWVPLAAKAPPALEALQVKMQKTEGRLSLSTAATADMKTLECSSYRVDLVLQCPRTLLIEVYAQEGMTALSGLGGVISVTQNAGAITAEHLLGDIKLSNQNGPITTTDCSGSTEVMARNGTITLTRNFAKVNAQCVQGRIIIESPQNDVFVRNNGGDIRILAMEGVKGNFDVLAEHGNLSMVLAPDADASLLVKTANGSVHSSIPLTGGITRDTQEFTAHLKEGKYTLRLEAVGGNIYLD